MRLTRHNFQRWLGKFGPDEIVGIRAKRFECPLRNYIADRTGSSVGVNGETYGCWPAGEPRPEYVPLEQLPEWAMEFVSRIDGHDGGSVITAAQALELLEGVR